MSDLNKNRKWAKCPNEPSFPLFSYLFGALLVLQHLQDRQLASTQDGRTLGEALLKT